MRARTRAPFAGLALLVALPVLAQPVETVDFDSDRWEKQGSQVVEHLGQKALRGGGSVKGLELDDGVIEVDVAVDGSRCFPGILFRMVSPTDAESFYLRPHRSGEPVSLQYTPVFNGLEAWQLYHGQGFTAAAEIAHDRWVHVRLEVKGTRARVYLDGAGEPALEVHSLKHPARKGTVALAAPPTGQVYFANLKVSGNAPDLPAPAEEIVLPGVLTRWRISQEFPVGSVNRALTPEAQELAGVRWQEVESEPSGLLNLSRWVAAPSLMPLCVFARTTIRFEEAQVKKLSFGYSDEVYLFLNGTLLFSGDASFQSRDPMFYGAVGLSDAVYLHLRPGDNDLLFAVAESFGGWGLMARLEPVGGGPALLDKGVTAAWATQAVLAIPESVVWDAGQQVFYVSSFVGTPPPGAEGTGFISRIRENGEVDELHWVQGLRAPSGLAVRGDRLFVVERTGVSEIATATGEVIRSHAVPGAAFLNDVAVDEEGVLYVSDSRRGVIFRVKNGTVEEWLAGFEVSQPNGVLVDGGRLIWGNNGDRCLKAADLVSRKVVKLFRLPEGTIDGLDSDGRGNLVVSHWQGCVYLVAPGGTARVLLDSRDGAVNAADLDYVPEQHLLVVPTFYDGRVVAYRVAE